ncbi:hypothetical protein [Algoriphagus winogradskyi]|uniref:Lipoprotein n=1 Tax=Algoriphagus winogradskyi TaxID=237017 RepID=A0ABY1NGB7_9BACT|nr:hypothetical protein [Algoriphagus winogradskyi]SMP08314.1 hypothetical protein SAMN06265367_101733 [Algoriphagus winogradskyi]
MKKFLPVFLIMTLISCVSHEEKGIEVVIKNNTDKMLTNVGFSTTEKLEVLAMGDIQADERVSDFLSMKNNIVDGAYSLTFTHSDGKKETSITGYYTNGAPLEKRVEYRIENDSTFVTFSKFGY